MKRTWIPMLLMTAALPSQADGLGSLTFRLSDGSTTSISAIGTTITFADGQMTASNGSERQSIPVAQLSAMYFGDTDGIGETGVASETTYTAYTLSGIQMGVYPTEQSLREALPTGIYVVKTTEKTYKISVKH